MLYFGRVEVPDAFVGSEHGWKNTPGGERLGIGR